MRKFQVTATITMSDEDIRELLEERKVKALDSEAEAIEAIGKIGEQEPYPHAEWEIEAAIKGMVAEFNDEMYENRDEGTEANELSIISFKEIT